MAGLTLILDGITLQHAGELLLDTSASRPFRRQCSQVYIRSLEDFAFASLLGEGIMATGSLPAVGDDTPGKTLWSMSPRISAIEGGKPVPTVAEVIQLPDVRASVISDLRTLLDAYRVKSKVWDEFFIREGQTYLGQDDSLREPAIPPEDYKFAENVEGVPRAAYYLMDPDLKESIPLRFVTSVAKVVRPYYSPTIVCDSALDEFVKRAALTHTAIYWWYDHVKGDEISDGRARIPFATRATLRLANTELAAIQAKALKDMILPHALSHAMEHAANDRERLIGRLDDMWGDPPYPYLRNRIREAVEALRRNDIAEAGELARDIRKYREGSARFPIVDATMLQIGVETAATKTLLPPKGNVLRKWVARQPFGRYEELLQKCFPELDVFGTDHETPRAATPRRKSKAVTPGPAQSKIPDRRRPGGPGKKTYIPDVLVRRPAPSLPTMRADDKAPALERALEERVFEHILNIIRMQSRQIEQSPGTYAGMGEEDRRQTIVATLNTHYEGRAHAEAFNNEGKTDILIRHEGRNLFICECKFWNGPEGFTETIDQLFRYTGWRDTKLAIVTFVREKGLTAILMKAKDTLAAHQQFVAWKDAAEETELRATVHWPGDEERMADLNVFFVHSPPAKKLNYEP